MARDYLAVPGASTASERAFSSMRHIGTDFRNALGTKTFEALQVLKSGYKNGVISAASEIAKAAGVSAQRAASWEAYTFSDIQVVIADTLGDGVSAPVVSNLVGG